ncbi:MAG: hypothetical protein ACOCR6_01870 [archaeon]
MDSLREAWTELGFDTPDANGDFGASISQMTLLIELTGFGWPDVEQLVEDGDLEEVAHDVELQDGIVVERVIRYRWPDLEAEEEEEIDE